MKQVVAFVIGNGTSRKNISLERLKKHGTIYGCNALYREFCPDYLIAVDTKMILEIAKTNYQDHNQVWTNYNRSFDKINNLNYFEQSKGWSSGPTALDMASNCKYDRIYILGFDYTGLNGLVNNVYAGTHNYKKINENATYYGNWLRQTQTVIKKNISIEYVRVINKDGFIPKELMNLQNLNHITIEEFWKKIENQQF